MNTLREYTVDEIRSRFLTHVRHMIKYWADLEGEHTVHERIEGALFSTFAAIDGCSIAVPAFMLVPIGTEEDKAYHLEHGENWYPITPDVDLCDIGGSLHDKLVNHDDV